MKKLFYIIFLLSVFSKSFSQTNLVPNWSFEDIISCPQTEGASFYSYTPPWYSPNENTPDIYNSCSTISSGCNVPHNWLGYQQAHTGIGYGGFAREAENAIEYLSVKLTSPMQDGKKYCVSFYVNPGNYISYVIDAIGAYISVDSIHVSGYGLLPFTPQIENPLGNIISDTVNWTEISGEYIAKGGEQFITIGSFFPDSMIHQAYNDTTIPPETTPYYFLDDVSVYYCGTDTVGINEIEVNKSNFNVYPNPVKDNFNIELSNPLEGNEKMFVSIYTIQGQLLIQQPIKQTNTEVDVSMLAKGVYIVKVDESRSTTFKKLIKE